MVVRDNSQYPVAHVKSHLDSIHLLSSIKDDFEYIFVARYFFLITSLLSLYINPLLMVVIVKPSGGGKF